MQNPKLEWRNWQTHGTQNPAAFTGHEGSTPSSSTTINSIVYRLPAFSSVQLHASLISEQIAGTVRSRMMAVRLSEALPHLTRDHLVRFLPNFRMVQYAPGETIVHQGDPPTLFL